MKKQLTDISEIPAPDMLSANSLSLSGSVRTLEVSDLFFKIDFERRCDSRFGDESIESIDSDNLFSAFPSNKNDIFSCNDDTVLEVKSNVCHSPLALIL